LLKKIITVLAVLVAAYLGLLQIPDDPPSGQPDGSMPKADVDQVAQAFRDKAGDRWVWGEGEVIKLLTDDLDGSRHQRFIVRLDSGQTLLIAHNIDLAPRVDSLDRGDKIGFSGIYEWNERGGVVHWTHHDPKGQTLGGWIEYQGKRYR
jgi:hypothetical protein